MLPGYWLVVVQQGVGGASLQNRHPGKNSNAVSNHFNTAGEHIDCRWLLALVPAYVTLAHASAPALWHCGPPRHIFIHHHRLGASHDLFGAQHVRWHGRAEDNGVCSAASFGQHSVWPSRASHAATIKPGFRVNQHLVPQHYQVKLYGAESQHNTACHGMGCITGITHWFLWQELAGSSVLREGFRQPGRPAQLVTTLPFSLPCVYLGAVDHQPPSPRQYNTTCKHFCGKGACFHS